MAENEGTDTKQSKDEQVEPIRDELLSELRAIEEGFLRIQGLFESIDDDKGVEYFGKKANNAKTMAGWYDPKAKLLAKRERLQAQLAKLQEELENESA